jgi:hypothetical protein
MQSLDLVRAKLDLPVSPEGRKKEEEKTELKPYDPILFQRVIIDARKGNRKPLTEYLKEYEGPRLKS